MTWMRWGNKPCGYLQKESSIPRQEAEQTPKACQRNNREARLNKSNYSLWSPSQWSQILTQVCLPPVIILLLILAMIFHKGEEIHPTLISLKTSLFPFNPQPDTVWWDDCLAATRAHTDRGKYRFSLLNQNIHKCYEADWKAEFWQESSAITLHLLNCLFYFPRTFIKW